MREFIYYYKIDEIIIFILNVWGFGVLGFWGFGERVKWVNTYI